MGESTYATTQRGGEENMKDRNTCSECLFQKSKLCPGTCVRHGVIIKVSIKHKIFNSMMMAFCRNMWLCWGACSGNPNMLYAAVTTYKIIARFQLLVKFLHMFFYWTETSDLIRWRGEVGPQFGKPGSSADPGAEAWSPSLLHLLWPGLSDTQWVGKAVLVSGWRGSSLEILLWAECWRLLSTAADSSWTCSISQCHWQGKA